MRHLYNLLGRLDLRPGEERPTLLLVALSFALSWTLVLADTAATALFLSAVGAAALPETYVATAVIVPLTGALFGWLGQRISADRMSIGVTAALTALLVLLWGGAALGPWALFALLIWCRIFSALSGVISWGMAGRVLNLRQSKRLYGVISSGGDVARVAGYAAVAPLVAWIGVANLIGVAVAGMLGGLAAALAIGRLVANTQAAPPTSASRRRAPPARGLRALLASPYTLGILGVFALSNWAYSALDLAFATQAAIRFSDPQELASFLAGFLLTLSVLRLVGRPLITGRLIGRYGVATAILTQPVALALGALLILAAAMGADPTLLFWGVAAVRMTDGALNALFVRPSLQILIQPLPQTQRVTLQSAGDSIVAPLALGTVGIVGVWLRGAPLWVMALILFAIGLLWAAVARQVGRSYLLALSQSLLHRFGLGGSADLSDPAALAHVVRALGSPHSGDVRYAIELLSQQMPGELERAAPALLSHSDPSIRRAALEPIAAGRVAADPALIEGLAASDPDLPTRATAIRALCAAAGADAIARVEPAIHDPSPEIQRSALVGLLRHGGIAGIVMAGQRLLDMAAAPAPADRTMAAAVAGELGSLELLPPIRRLIADPDAAVRRAALAAAGRIGSARALDDLIAALGDRGAAAVAADSIERIGADATAPLATALRAASPAIGARIAGILGRIGGGGAADALLAVIDHPDGGLRSAACAGLVACGYRAAKDEAGRLRAQIQREAAQAAWVLAADADLDQAQAGVLSSALAADLERCRERILRLLAVTTDAQAVAAARANLGQGTPERRAYAVEIIDVLLPTDLRPAVMPLFDEVVPAEQLRRLRARFPEASLSHADRLRQLAAAPDLPIGAWARSCAATLAAAGDGAPSPERTATALIVDRVAALARVPLFSRTPGELLADIASRMVAVRAEAGAQIFARGDAGYDMYIVMGGVVRIHADGQTLNIMREGDVFGEMAILDPAPRIASADALEPTDLLRLSQRDMDQIIDERPEVGRGLIRTLTRTLRSRLDDLATIRARIDSAGASG